MAGWLKCSLPTVRSVLTVSALFPPQPALSHLKPLQLMFLVPMLPFLLIPDYLELYLSSITSKILT